MAAASDDNIETEWDAYSDYALVSKWVAQSIRDAIEAYALLDQAAMTNRKVTTNEETKLRADIVSAAMRLQTELQQERDRNKEFAKEILTRWEDSDDGEEPGYITRFRTAQSGEVSQLEFLNQFAQDIRRAGWELGYLQAGREEETRTGGDDADGEVLDLIEEMSK